MLVRYEGGCKGIIYASQISTGDENNLNIRVYGTEASIEWHQEHPNELIVKFADAPREIWRRGNSYNGPEASKYTRLPFGHPEAFIEAFANVYLSAAEAISDDIEGTYPRPKVDTTSQRSTTVSPAWRSSRQPSPPRRANAAWTPVG